MKHWYFIFPYTSSSDKTATARIRSSRQLNLALSVSQCTYISRVGWSYALQLGFTETFHLTICELSSSHLKLYLMLFSMEFCLRFTNRFTQCGFYFTDQVQLSLLPLICDYFPPTTATAFCTTSTSKVHRIPLSTSVLMILIW